MHLYLLVAWQLTLVFKIKYCHTSASPICSCRILRLIKNMAYYQSTNFAPIEPNKKKIENHSEYPFLDTKFNQYQIAYRYRDNLELLRGYLVYRLFSMNFLVNNQEKVKLNQKRYNRFSVQNKFRLQIGAKKLLVTVYSRMC